MMSPVPTRRCRPRSALLDDFKHNLRLPAPTPAVNRILEILFAGIRTVPFSRAFPVAGAFQAYSSQHHRRIAHEDVLRKIPRPDDNVVPDQADDHLRKSLGQSGKTFEPAEIAVNPAVHFMIALLREPLLEQSLVLDAHHHLPHDILVSLCEQLPSVLDDLCITWQGRALDQELLELCARVRRQKRCLGILRFQQALSADGLEAHSLRRVVEELPTVADATCGLRHEQPRVLPEGLGAPRARVRRAQEAVEERLEGRRGECG
mmetsp:Transcript_67651/g.220234  ORF Transcript_67651/g.220234 Transcript_67651/m.220234 type:complete len:262 (-) Transcript_67651:180-965(-)